MPNLPNSPDFSSYYGGVQTPNPVNVIYLPDMVPSPNAAVNGNTMDVDQVNDKVYMSTKPGTWVLLGDSLNTSIKEIDVDADTPPGTNPVLAAVDSHISLTGGQVASGTVGANVIRTNSVAAHEITIEIQRSTAVASTDSTKNGVAHFNSTEFTVDSNGFVSLIGGGVAVDSIGVDAFTAPGTNPVAPSGAGLITITGAQVASGTVGANVIRTDSLAANSLTIEVQRTTAVAAADSTKNGVAHFDSGAFSVDSSGFVTLKGGGEAIDSFIPDSGTSPVVPAANGSVTMAGSGSITTVGGTNTLTTQLTGLTNHAVLVGAGTSTITKVGPSATTGAAFISGGAAADPRFSTTFSITDSTATALLTANIGGTVTFNAQNTSAAGSSLITALANSPGVGFFSSGVADDLKFWNYGIVPSNAATNPNGFNITYNPVGQSDPSVVDVGGAIVIEAKPTGVVALPNAASALYIGTDSPSTASELTVQKNVSGGQVLTVLFNSSNTASSNSVASIAVAGSSAGDPYLTYNIASSQSWSTGIRNADSDSFYLTSVSGLASNVIFKATTGGAITFNSAYTFPTADGTAGQVLTTNGAGQLSFANSGEGTWTAISANQTLAVNNGYFCTGGGALSLALPAVSAVGDTIDVVLDGSTSWTITQPNAATRIRLGSSQTTLGVGGSLASTAQGDTVKLVCETANARWVVVSSMGSITVV